jgi:hypothetical protein
MADTKISAEPVAGTLDGTEVVPAVQSASNVKLSLNTLKTFLLSGLSITAAQISDSTAAGRAFLTAATAAAQTALLNTFTTSLKGLTPASGGGVLNFLRADGTWSPSGPLNNYSATAVPTVSNDTSQGYSVGSSWLIPGTGDMWRLRDATTGAARWVKIDVADHPGYVAGRYYLPFGQGAVTSGAALATGQIYLTFAIIKERITISQLGVRLTTASAGGNFQLGVYSHNTATASPGVLEGFTGSGSTASATLVNVATTAGQVLEAGPHWFAIQADNATAVFLAQALASPAHVALVGDPTAAIPAGTSNGSQTVGVSTPATFGTWPADLSAATLTNTTIGRIPLIQFLVASVP